MNIFQEQRKSQLKQVKTRNYPNLQSHTIILHFIWAYFVDLYNIRLFIDMLFFRRQCKQLITTTFESTFRLSAFDVWTGICFLFCLCSMETFLLPLLEDFMYRHNWAAFHVRCNWQI